MTRPQTGYRITTATPCGITATVLTLAVCTGGYWLPVKPGWYYGCGEYGAEGLDSAEVMEECYPREWLREPFDPGHIVRSQTKSFSGFFYDAQEDMQGWISRSQRIRPLPRA